MSAASRRAHLALVLAGAALAFALGGCGEKEEPDFAEGGGGPAAAEDGFEITGEWRGRLRQRGLDPFVVTAEIRGLDDPERNTVHYTGIDCSGNWTYLGREGPDYRFREAIDRGRGGDCKGRGVVVLRPIAPDRLEYGFTGGGVRSEGTLARVG
jgi:hypothetical protein